MQKKMNCIINSIFVGLVLTISLEFDEAQSESVTVHDSCSTKMSCRACIQTQNCAWCLQTSYENRTRCFQPGLRITDDCTLKWYPRNEENITEESPLTQKQSSSSVPLSKNIVQISPQRVSLKLRINEVHKMDFKYSQAEDYPVDLYYLMDLSSSMKDDKNNLSKLATLLSSTMKNISSKFHLGFGSFVDKVLMPFTSTVPHKLTTPCDGCVSPFGFKNNMPLSNDTDKFAKEVDRAIVSGNIDSPEGGFDAIMQAVVCQNKIGWRKQARRLVLFTTDAGFHHAGDGKLAGIIEPNDGLCHLLPDPVTKIDTYTLSSEQDYPSISQINLKVKENSVNLIFAVTSEQKNIYKLLSKQIEGSTSAVLSDDSSNIVELVRDQYNKISSSVEMKDNAPSFIKVNYYSKCLGKKRTLTSKCDGLKVGTIVTFEIEILATSCPVLSKDWKQSFKIYTVGINETLTVDLELLCSCPCEETGEKNSNACKGYGTLQCGICKCNNNYYGRFCDCANSDPNKNQHQCRPDNVTDIDCSGNGNCVCGQCICRKESSGNFCECDNSSCDRNNGVVCSGQGICDCGSCKCQPGWSGSACECRSSQDTCIVPNALNGEICSGHGSCVCGKCECEIKDGVRYSGKYCEKCPTCLGRCNELKDCVECQMYKKGLLKDADDCAKNCTLFVPVEVETVDYDEDKDEHLCTFYYKDDCRYQFVYNTTEFLNGSTILGVRAQKTPFCDTEKLITLVMGGIGVIASIVLIGLGMLLLWKLLTTIHDRREFTRFEKEKLMANWEEGENPLYKKATSKFENPTFGG